MQAAEEGHAGGADEERLFRGYAGRLFLTVTVGAAAMKLGRFLIPPLLPVIITDLGISPFRAGLALSLVPVVFAVMQYPSGRLSDRLSRKTVLVASFALALVAFGVLANSSTYLVFLVGLFVIGAGDGLYGPAVSGLLSDLFRTKRGQAFGIHMTAIDVGGILAAGLGTAIVIVATWREGFLVVLALLAVVAVAYVRFSDESIVLERVDLGVRETGVRLFSDARLLFLLVAYSLFVFTVVGFVNFLPTLLQVDHGFSPAFANSVYAGLFAIGILVKPAAGRLSDRAHRLRIVAGALALAAIGVVLLAFAPSAATVIAAIGIFGVGQKAFGPVMRAYLMDFFPDASMGGDLGALRTVFIGVGAIGPTYVGFVAERASYKLAFAGFAVCLVGAALVVIWLAISESTTPP